MKYGKKRLYDNDLDQVSGGNYLKSKRIECVGMFTPLALLCNLLIFSSYDYHVFNENTGKDIGAYPWEWLAKRVDKRNGGSGKLVSRKEYWEAMEKAKK